MRVFGKVRRRKSPCFAKNASGWGLEVKFWKNMPPGKPLLCQKLAWMDLGCEFLVKFAARETSTLPKSRQSNPGKRNFGKASLPGSPYFAKIAPSSLGKRNFGKVSRLERPPLYQKQPNLLIDSEILEKQVFPKTSTFPKSVKSKFVCKIV